MTSNRESHRGIPDQGAGETPEQLREMVADFESREEEQRQKHEVEMASLRQDMEHVASRLRDTEQLLQNSEGNAAAEADRLREELKLLREDASRFSREDDREIRQLRRAKQDADKRIETLSSEVEELRAVIREYVERINGSDNGTGVDNTAALRQELKLVREQAETDFKALRKQLRDRELSGSAETAENEVLRREILDYQRTREELETALEKAAETQRSQLEEVELHKSEVDRLGRALEIARTEADEHKLRRREEADVRMQVETTLQDTQQKVEDLQASVHESRFNNPDTAVSRAGSNLGARGMLIAAVLAFALADVLAVVGGRGEILTGLFSGGQSSEPDLLSATEVQDVTPIERQGQRSEPSGSGDGERVTTDVASGDMPALTPLTQKSAPAPGSEPATGTILQDRLRRGGRGPVMIYVRGGEFVMGRDRDQLNRDERPPHGVNVSRFAISRDEVTYDDYAAFSRATGRRLPDDQGWGTGDRPVINVSWNDAVEYTKWLSQQSGSRYRLPSEAEWEYAAAAGSDSFYWWGYQMGDGHASCFDCGSRWDRLSTAPAGSFEANPFGINDTAGNVMEWAQDCYHGSYDGAPSDGSAWVSGECTERVARGGAYNTPGDSLRTAKRFHFHPDTRLPVLGFRVVREL